MAGWGDTNIENQQKTYSFEVHMEHLPNWIICGRENLKEIKSHKMFLSHNGTKFKISDT